ncbi:hypothetical protein H7F33_09800 [Pedobacter sp. PAMC26386]|nr:hypothetical protein H7F33_09800 [Pedobacter sp. PAMC26386]
MMNFKFLLIMNAMLLQWPHLTKNWEGSDTPGHCYATFEDFNGKQDFRVKILKDETFNLKYSAIVKKGTLHLAIKVASKTVYEKDITGTIAEAIKVENPKGKPCKFIFTAQHADGSFDVGY